MRLSCKELADAWGIAVTKVTQARTPTFRKVARAMILYPEKTMAELVSVMETERVAMARELTEKNSPANTCGDALLPRELYLREDMLCGRIDRTEIHPKNKGREPGLGSRGPDMEST